MGREGDARLNGPPRRWELDGELYELRTDWRPLVEHLRIEEWRLPLLLDMTVPADADALRDRLWDREDDLSVTDLYGVAERLVLLATGHPWWVPQQLLCGAVDNFTRIDGDLSREGVDLAELIRSDPARAVNVVYSWSTRGADEKELAKFDMKLFTPPAGAWTEEMEEELAEAEGNAWEQAMSQSKRSGMVRKGARQT